MCFYHYIGLIQFYFSTSSIFISVYLYLDFISINILFMIILIVYFFINVFIDKRNGNELSWPAAPGGELS